MSVQFLHKFHYLCLLVNIYSSLLVSSKYAWKFKYKKIITKFRILRKNYSDMVEKQRRFVPIFVLKNGKVKLPLTSRRYLLNGSKIFLSIGLVILRCSKLSNEISEKLVYQNFFESSILFPGLYFHPTLHASAWQTFSAVYGYVYLFMS